MTSDKKFAPIEFARRLRNSQTSTEFLLWQILRGRKRYGLKFRRQHPIGIYTVDFCCLEYKLVIECDGLGHFSDEGKRYDAQRDRWLNEQGYQVLRFTGQQIEYQTQETLAILDQTIFALKDRNRTSDSKSQEPSPPGPLSHKNGRGGDSTSVMAQHQNQPDDRNDLELQIRPARQNRPNGFTLVELMAVIVIIGILTALVLGAMRGALIDSQTAKTRGTIAKIDAVLSDRMDQYLTQRLKFDVPSVNPVGPRLFVSDFPIDTTPSTGVRTNSTVFRKPDSNWSTSGGQPPVAFLRERTRIAAIRDLMRLEMPDRIGDMYVRRTMTGTLVLNDPIEIETGFQTNGGGLGVKMRLERPQDFVRIHQKIANSRHFLTNTFFNEELLYLIVEGTYIGGSSAIETFAANEIADTDGDGLFEFIDAWQNPIRWIRWPTGIGSVAPFDPDPLNPSTSTGVDPFDPGQADIGFDPANIVSSAYPFAPGYIPKPLVISPGPDRRFGIRFFWRTTYLPNPSLAFPPTLAPPDVTPVMSTSNVIWPLVPSPHTPSSNPLAPAYASPIRWPDPFHPRFTPYDDPMTAPIDIDPGRYRLGGNLSNEVDFLITDGEVLGVGFPTSTATEFAFGYVPRSDAETDIINSSFMSPAQKETAMNALIRQYTHDNVSNLDESGASL